MQGFHRTYATGVACQQRMLTPPDTWSCPTLGLACVLMSREKEGDPSLLNLSCLRTFEFRTSLGTSLLLLTINPLCITSSNCLWYVSVLQNYPGKYPMHVENVQNIDILSFRSYYDLLSEFGEISFQEYVMEGI